MRFPKYLIWIEKLVVVVAIFSFAFASYCNYITPSLVTGSWGYIMAAVWAVMYIGARADVCHWQEHAADLVENLHNLAECLTKCQVYVCHNVPIPDKDKTDGNTSDGNSNDPDNPNETDGTDQSKKELADEDKDRMHAAKDMVDCAREAISMLASGADELNVCQGCVSVKITVVHKKEDQENSEKPDNPENPDNPDNPDNPENPDNSENQENTETK